jgi:hypothetical protein
VKCFYFHARRRRLLAWGKPVTRAFLVISILALNLALSQRPASAATVSFPRLTQQGYVWENDDQTSSSTVDSDSAQAAGNTPITAVAVGERLTLRTQLTNTGGALAGTTGLSLFYDRNDGIWSKVRTSGAPLTSAGSCADTNFNCGVVDLSATEGNETAIALDASGNPWMAYQDKTNSSLRVAHYIGSGGNCGTSSAWQCTTVDGNGGGSSDATGTRVNLAIGPDNTPWITYYDTTRHSLSVAHYVNSGGSGCATSAWTCGTVDSTSDRGNSQTGIGFDSSGNAWISYYDSASNDLWTAHYVGSGGTGCSTTGTWNNAWAGAFSCLKIDSTGDVGQYSSLAVDPSGSPWISYWDATNGNLRVAHYVGTSGSGCATGVSSWTCESVDSGGSYGSIAFSPSGVAWVSYYDTTNAHLRYASYASGSGTGCSASGNWTCATADANSGTGRYTSIAFDPAGEPWISEWDATNTKLKLSRYTGTSGSGCGSGVTGWVCTTVDSSAGNVGSFSSIAFDSSGAAWISYADSSNGTVRAAWINRGAEILATPGLGGNNNGSSLTTSQSDMTSTSDSANKTDADCLAPGATWNNGKWINSETGSLSLPDGNSTSQCTEVAFMISTAQAKPSTTYRFVVATNDSFATSRSAWRGPATIASYPTLTTAGTQMRVAKSSVSTASTLCTDSNWACIDVDNTVTAGAASSIAFDSSGVGWIAYSDTTDSALKWAKRVGTGGSGCTSGVTTWTCSILDSNTGHDFSGGGTTTVSMQMDSSGNPWVAYYDAGASYLDLRVAHYVGSGGTGCASGVTTWTCTTVDSAGTVGKWASMAIDRTGTPWISYYDATNKYLRVAHYVTSGGTGCALSTWTCTSVATANDSGSYSSINIDGNGNPWVSYRVNTTTQLAVARYVGTGGSGCTIASWTCYAVDTTGNTGQYTSLTFDGSGTAWVGYYDVTNQTQRMAHYVGSGGGSSAGCGSGSSTAWSCTVLDNSTANIGTDEAMATDSTGSPWLMYLDVTNSKRMEAHYVGSGGTGCATGVTTWTCGILAGSPTGGGLADIAFDADGSPWTSYQLNPPSSLTVTSALPLGGHSARRGDGKYLLDSGGSPRGTTCGAAANLKGYCGVQTNDTAYDSLTSNAYERPAFTVAYPSSSNSSFPSLEWIGQTSFSNTMNLQVYRFGTTNAWVTLASQSSPTTGTDYTLIGTAATGSASEYWQSDGSKYWAYYRFYQSGSTSSSFTLKTNYLGGTLAPNAPVALAQATASGSTIATGGWSQTPVQFSASVSDQDPSDLDALCVEIQPVTTTFTNSDTSCGSGVAYSGTAVTASVSITGLTSGTSYHWQARTKDVNGSYSSWQSYGGNSDVVTAATDVRIDNTAPTTGTVYDGATVGVETAMNDGSTTTLSANWSGFADGMSGVASYDYSIGTTAGGTDVLAWTNTASTSFTNSTLALNTSKTYYINVRAYDSVGNRSSVASSTGQRVAPTLTFSVGSLGLDFGGLYVGNSSTQSDTISVTTNASTGYQVLQQATQPLTSPQSTIAMYGSGWASPSTWSGFGFGYTSSDTSVAGFNRFAGATAYAGLSLSSPGDIVADSLSPTLSGDTYGLTYKVTAPLNQTAGLYATKIVFSCLANY